MIKVGIIGGAGYTAGELIRLLLHHPDAEIAFVHSSSNAKNLLTDVHEGLLGETDMKFTDRMPLKSVDVLFLCMGHGKSAEFLAEHPAAQNLRIIDLAQDFRISSPDHDYVYGLPELNREEIVHARHVANPGCFATAIQLGLLPLAANWLLLRRERQRYHGLYRSRRKAFGNDTLLVAHGEHEHLQAFPPPAHCRNPAIAGAIATGI